MKKHCEGSSRVAQWSDLFGREEPLTGVPWVCGPRFRLWAPPGPLGGVALQMTRQRSLVEYPPRLISSFTKCGHLENSVEACHIF